MVLHLEIDSWTWDNLAAKDFVREIETDHYTLRGRDHYNDYPAFVRELSELCTCPMAAAATAGETSQSIALNIDLP